MWHGFHTGMSSERQNWETSQEIQHHHLSHATWTQACCVARNREILTVLFHLSLSR